MWTGINNEVSTYENGKAYQTTMNDDLCTIFTLGCFNGEFYEDPQTAVLKTDSILQQALQDCPEKATKYAVYAAETLRMKLMPTVWLVYLSTLTDKTLFKKAFPRIINGNIKLLHDFIEICRNTSIRPGGHMKQRIKNSNRGLGSGLKKIINAYLYEIMNDYNVTRYVSKLEDICRLTRIKDTEKSINYLQYIFKPRNGQRRLTFDRAKYLNETLQILSLPQQNNNITEAQLNVVIEHIHKYKIQMEEIKSTFGYLPNDILRKIYEAFIPTLSYAALITNLNAIEKVYATSIRTIDKFYRGARYEQEEVLETDVPLNIIDIVAQKIQDINAYKRSGLFFMRLYAAAKMIKTSKWIEALDKVFMLVAKEAFSDISDNTRVRVSADTSGSMDTKVTNSISARDIATYFTAACALSIPNTKAYATATITKEVPLATNNIKICAETIAKTNVGYGTEFETLLKGYRGENIVLIITDVQQSDNTETMWKKLHKPKDAKFIIWDVVGYVGRNRISLDPSILYLRGYSDRNISLISNLILGKAGQTDVINTVTL